MILLLIVVGGIYLITHDAICAPHHRVAGRRHIAMVTIQHNNKQNGRVLPMVYVAHTLTFTYARASTHNHIQELFIKGLAESKTFQRFALHTDKHIQKYKREGLEHVNSHLDELHKHATTTMRAASSSSSSSSSNASSYTRGATVGGGGDERLKPPQKPMQGIPGFFSALSRVIQRDLGMLGNRKQ